MNNNKGTQLENERNRYFYESLKIPEDKIMLEEKRIGIFSGCPFFLRRFDEVTRMLEVITLHSYPREPKGDHVFVELPKSSIEADRMEVIELTKDIIDDLLVQGFVWFHESEMDTLW